MQNEPRDLWLFILFHRLACILSVIWSVRSAGLRVSIRFFAPVCLASFALEAAGVLTGKYVYPDYPFQVILSGEGLPVIIILGWSNIITYVRLLARALIGPAGSLFWIAFLAAILGVAYDAIQDPIALRLGWWDWPGHAGEAAFLGVPVTNFFVWFVFLFFMILFLGMIDKQSWSENRKLITSILGLPAAGLFMLAGQMIFRLIFGLIGWL
jgi:uncharacterized membrane protein